MTPSQIITFTRNLSWCRSDELSDAILLDYENIEYRKLWQEIAGIDKNYKLRTWTTNLVQWVSSYALDAPVQSPTPTNGQLKIENVLIQYNSTQNDKYMARLLDWDNLEYDPSWYAVNQPITNPFYIITDNSIQIFPTPKNSIAGGIVLYANQRPYDLTLAMSESDILVEREYHDVIWWAMIPYIYQHRQQDDRVMYYQQQYEEKKRKMMTNIKKRAIRPMQWFSATFNQYIR